MSQAVLPKLIRVGELAKAVGKTVRALHLYEELELLEPAARSDGGFRLYGPEAIERIHWIGKLQAIGFSLTEIQGFVRDFHDAETGRDATSQVRAVFQERLQTTRAQIAELRSIERDLHDALAYLDSCQGCATGEAPSECGVCSQPHHGRSQAPHLFAGLSRAKNCDVPLVSLLRESPRALAGEPGRAPNAEFSAESTKEPHVNKS